MGRRRGRKGRRSKSGIALLPLVAPIDLAARCVTKVMGWGGGTAYSIQGIPTAVMYETTGYDMGTGQMDWSKAKRVVGLVVVGQAGHMVANKTVNRKLGALTKKFFGVRITF